MCTRVAHYFFHGCYVNLGIGLPSQVADAVPPGMHVVLQSENGVLGVGPYPAPDAMDADLVNAGKETITLLPGGSFQDSATGFGMIRGGHIDITVLGALQVSAQGDLASWVVPGQALKGMGGAMDLVVGVKRVIVIMQHCTKTGEPKLLETCTYPLTGTRAVQHIVTDYGMFDVTPVGLLLRELAPEVTLERLREITPAPFRVALIA
jgi:3-oxoacid CoA-transferase subunit B